MQKRPNILLVILDATRYDVCSCYGFPQPTTPCLDQLAREGVLFETAISAAPWTLPAIASIFTGLYPSQIDIYGRRELDPHFPTLAGLLAQSGYTTFGISNNDWLSGDFGLQRGFHSIHRLWQLVQTNEDITSLSVSERSIGRGSIAMRALRRALRGSVAKNVLNTAYYKFGRYRKDYGAARTMAPLVSWIGQQRQPWFAFVHYLDPHLQYKPPDSFARRFVTNWERARRLLRADQWRLCWRHNAGVELLSEADLQTWRELYLAEVAYTDYHLGQVVAWLKETRRLDNTLVVVAADHGESLGEHGLLNHSYSLHEPLIRVPLIIRYPSLFTAGQRVEGPVQTTDLFATLLAVAGIIIPPGVASRSLLEEGYQRDATLSEYGVPLPPHAEDLARFDLKQEDLVHRQRGLTALRTHTHKLVVATDGAEQLYDLRADPNEQYDIANAQPQLAALLRQRLQTYWQEHNISGLIGLPTRHNQVDPQVEARLQALGYLE